MLRKQSGQKNYYNKCLKVLVKHTSVGTATVLMVPIGFHTNEKKQILCQRWNDISAVGTETYQAFVRRYSIYRYVKSGDAIRMDYEYEFESTIVFLRNTGRRLRVFNGIQT